MNVKSDPKTISDAEVSAETRARVALEEHLSPRQRAELDQGFIVVRGRRTKYKLIFSHGAVQVREAGESWEAYVKGRDMHWASGDLLLATLLAIQNHEDDWRCQSRMCGNVFLLGGR